MIAKAWTKANAMLSPSSTMIARFSCIVAFLAASLILQGCDDPLDPQTSFLFMMKTTTTTSGGVTFVDHGPYMDPGLPIRVVGRQIVVNGAPLHMKGVNWNPVGKGGSHPANIDYHGYVVQDSQLMASAGINVVRTYEAITDTSVLDTLWSHRIYVIPTVYSYGDADLSTIAQKVAPVKDHPAILMWGVGNEWNYNGLHANLNFHDARTRVRDAVRAVKKADSNHPVTTIVGELPGTDTIAFLNDVDVWGINVYRGIGFGALFQQWAALSNLPMFLGEYGADAYDARFDRENQATQAQATIRLTKEIVAQSSATGGVCAGGIIFEFADEWWKAGSPSTHDAGGAPRGGGPYPDSTFNEEWWGLLDIDRNPRQAYTAYANVGMPGGGTSVSPTTAPTPAPPMSCDDTPAPVPANLSATCGGRWQWLVSQGDTSAAAKCKVKNEDVKCACLTCTQVAPPTPAPPTPAPPANCDDTPAPVPANLSATCGGRWRWLVSRGDTAEAAKCRVKSEEGKCACLRPTQVPPTPAPAGAIRVIGRQIVVNGAPLHMKGVNWNPVRKGAAHPAGLDYCGTVVQDSQLMASAGINVVRTYEAITDTYVLDILWSHGIYVIPTVYGYGGVDISTIAPKVAPAKSHPAILMWGVGNEWNYNGLYVNLNFNAARTRVRDAVRAVKQADPNHPVATIYGELPSSDTISFLSDVDVWGVNVYRGIGFGDLFQKWAALSGLPMFLGEYGADAYDARVNQENQTAQAQATTALTQAIVAQSSVTGGVCSGGIIFEFADEWWKAGAPSTHDTGGIAPGGGPYPDSTFNEEWWGLVDIDRSPRQAYTAYANVGMPTR